MLIEVNRKVLEQFVQDRAFMYKLVNNWLIETDAHYSWHGVGLHYGRKHLIFRPRGATQISIKYEDYSADCLSDLRHIEKRVMKYKGRR